MDSNLHPSEFQNHWISAVRAQVTAYSTLVLAVGLLLGCFAVKNHWGKTALLLLASGATVASRVAKENQVEKSLIIQDYRDISDASRQQRLYELMKPEAEPLTIAAAPVAPFEPDLFNLADLVTYPDRFPHLMILGSTGSGKTTLAEALHRMMHGNLIAVHPHWQAEDNPSDSDFAYCSDIIGAGRDFEAIREFISDIHQEMDERAKLTKPQLRGKPFYNILIDELPAIAKNCSEATIEQLISLLFEARKFRIRLMVLAQADSVKILRLEGQGAVRENLTYIKLGALAIDHAKWLVGKKRVDERLIGWLESVAYPCMIEDQPCLLPSISKGQFLTLPTNPTDPPPNGGNFLSYPAEGGNFLGNSTQTLTGQVIQFPTPDKLPMVDPPLLTQILTLKREGNLSSDWIKNHLGIKGKYYAGARLLLDKLFSEVV